MRNFAHKQHITQCKGLSNIRKASILVFSVEYGCIASITGWNRNYVFRTEAEKKEALLFEYRPIHYPTLLYQNEWHVDRQYSGYVSMNSFIPLISGLHVYNWNYNILSNQTYYSNKPTLLKIIDLLHSWRDKEIKKMNQLKKENTKLKQTIEVKHKPNILFAMTKQVYNIMYT